MTINRLCVLGFLCVSLQTHAEAINNDITSHAQNESASNIEATTQLAQGIKLIVVDYCKAMKLELQSEFLSCVANGLDVAIKKIDEQRASPANATATMQQ